MDCVKPNSDTEQLKLQGYEARDEDTVMNVFNKILEQGRFSINSYDGIFTDTGLILKQQKTLRN